MKKTRTLSRVNKLESPDKPSTIDGAVSPRGINGKSVNGHRAPVNGNGKSANGHGASVNGKSINGHGITVLLTDHGGRRLRQLTDNPASASAAVLEQLYGALARVSATANPRTFNLLQSGRHKLARKLIEEACEVTVEAVKRDASGVVRESADLLYHLMVLWFRTGIDPIVVWQEMQSRANAFGIAEKLPKTSNHKTTPANHNC